MRDLGCVGRMFGDMRDEIDKQLLMQLVDIIVDQFGGKRKGQGLVGKVKALFK